MLIIICYDDASIIGRRGTKRKVEAQENPMKEKKGKKLGEDVQEGLKVVIEHWWVLRVLIKHVLQVLIPAEFIY